MAIFDIFNKKKKTAKNKPAVKKEALLETTFTKRKKAPKFEQAYGILRTPHITEKAGDLAAKNLYVFKVWPRANKLEIKKAVKGLYGVDAVSVRIVKVLPKKRRLGRISGWTKGYKKAIVKTKKGQKIELLPK